MAEELTIHKETIKISGDRNMYLYTFEQDGKSMPEMRKEDVVGIVTEPEKKPEG